MILFHFGKRLYESHFIHIFSHATVPVKGIIKNMVGYWGFFGLVIPVELFYLRDPKFGPCWFPCRTLEFLCFVLFMVCEYGNYHCHVVLRNLRVKYVGGK